jgi:nucleotide-binding universal stress UspA family protein
VAIETSDEASRLVNVAVDQLGEAGVEASGEWTLANRFTLPSRIADAAARSGACAILFGSHRHRRVHRLIGRGVRERVTRITPLPVLTAPPPLRLGARRRGPMAEAHRLARHADSTMRT